VSGQLTREAVSQHECGWWQWWPAGRVPELMSHQDGPHIGTPSIQSVLTASLCLKPHRGLHGPVSSTAIFQPLAADGLLPSHLPMRPHDSESLTLFRPPYPGRESAYNKATGVPGKHLFPASQPTATGRYHKLALLHTDHQGTVCDSPHATLYVAASRRLGTLVERLCDRAPALTPDPAPTPHPPEAPQTVISHSQTVR
jgi:hypothetical protein